MRCESYWSVVVEEMFETGLEEGGHFRSWLRMKHHSISSSPKPVTTCCVRRRRRVTWTEYSPILTIFPNFQHYYLITTVCVLSKSEGEWPKNDWTKQGGGVNLEIWPSALSPVQQLYKHHPSLHPPVKHELREYIFYEQDEPEILLWLVHSNLQFYLVDVPVQLCVGR